MRMWHPRIQKDLPRLTLIPRGFGGSHYTDVIHYRETLIFQYAPRALLLYEGDNDAAYGKSLSASFMISNSWFNDAARNSRNYAFT